MAVNQCPICGKNYIGDCCPNCSQNSSEKATDTILTADTIPTNETQNEVATENGAEQNSVAISKTVAKANIVFAKVKGYFAPEKLKKTIILIAIFAVILSSVVGVLTYFSPESIAKRFAIAYEEDDLRKMSMLTAFNLKKYLLEFYDDEEDFFEYEEEYYDEDINSWHDYFKVTKNSRVEVLDDAFGNYKITAKVTKSKNLSAKKLESSVSKNLYTDLEHFCDFDTDSISKGKEISVTIRINGEDHNGKDYETVYLAKIHGFWKVIDW